MKKLFLLIVLALVASASFAQRDELYSLLYRELPRNCWDVDIMQQRDGDYIIHTVLSKDEADICDECAFYRGSMLYKVSRTASSLTFIDSLFIDDTLQYSYLLARDPRGEGNLLAALEYHEGCDSTFLRICHFPDDELSVNHEEDLLVPVCLGVASGDLYCQIVDSQSDIIIKYVKVRREGGAWRGCDEYLARISPDGMMKHQAMITENSSSLLYPLRQFKEVPPCYYFWKKIPDNYLSLYMVDSLFETNLVLLPSILRQHAFDPMGYVVEHERLNINYDTEVIPIGGNEVLVAAQYQLDTNNYPITAEYGVAVAKYDIRTMQVKDFIVFNDYLGSLKSAQCVGFKMMSDGSVYFLYKERGYPDESVVIVKMDTDLNVEWKRFCKTGEIALSPILQYPIMFEDDQGEERGIAWHGYGWNTVSGEDVRLLFFLNHDGIPASVDDGITIRPYAYYPNPAKDRLHLQYSPDVEPKQIELYDLQGRLVRSQTKALESLNMEGLPAGQYVMKVTMEDGKTFTDKVVKE